VAFGGVDGVWATVAHFRHDEVQMQFVLLVYQGSTPLPNTPAWATLSEDEQQAIYADYAAINSTPGVTPGLPFGLVDQARSVTVSNGTTQVTDGPYCGDPDKAAAGYSVFEADSIDEAIELAARIPAARLGGGVEIRPVATYW
jgi:hypothetical protein